MNKTEQAYNEVLQTRLEAGELLSVKFEPMKLRLADRTFYEPDFLVVLSNGEMEFHEVKGRPGQGPGGWMDDARVKIKVAAKEYWEYHFVGVSKLPRDGGWKVERF
ncbi:hypothetical protein [Rubinisphaera brasiliensis]|nr:hypothetical protein [Rubinisphaera brasiliensis]